MTQVPRSKQSGLRWLPSFGQVAAVLSVLALLSLSFGLGAASMFFGFPPSGFFTQTFNEAAAYWDAHSSGTAESGSDAAAPAAITHKASAASPGYTLCTTTEKLEALLVDMHGDVVHRWIMNGRRPWDRAPDVPDPMPNERLHWERCYLYANGDVLALCAGGKGGPAPYGYGLAKFDKDSKLLWAYSGQVHHDIDVGEDGRIYTLGLKTGVSPPAGLDVVPEKYTSESLLVLSPKGGRLQEFPLLEALRDSPYFLSFLDPTIVPGPNKPVQVLSHGFWREANDIIHANSVKVLGKSLAKKFPRFKAGDVLISLRTSCLLLVMDPQTGKVNWAARGPWLGQHDAQFLDNGHLLIYDNVGSPRGSRILEYDPISQAILRSCVGLPIIKFRGTVQRLPNGNDLYVEPERRVVEVMPSQEVVWEWACPLPRSSKTPTNADDAPNITCARRYTPSELTFLRGGSDARPR